jgi:hypothetical protein
MLSRVKHDGRNPVYRQLVHESCASLGLLLAAMGVLHALACTESAQTPSRIPAEAGLGADADPKLLAFVAELRRAIEAGDTLAVDRLANWEKTPDHLVYFIRRRILPKGPITVEDIQLEPMERDEGPVIEFEGVTYELNVVPVGTLVIELRDVSVGALSQKMIIGTRDGEYRLAGMRPQG